MHYAVVNSMISPLVEKARVDRTALSVVNLHEDAGEVQYWLAQPAIKRFEALELLRQMAHPYDPSARIERVLTIIEREER
jgi:hypothetical protein